MPANSFTLFGSFCLALLIAAPAVAQIDSSSLKSASRKSPSYDSGHSTGDRMGYGGPEKSARPGLYFFDKGVDAFQKDQYAFAIDMYEVSASWAYKPAQYNLSVMYARGQGVPVDTPRAMAWVTLAAERGEPRYITARDAIHVTLSSEQVDEANRILEQLKPKYADLKALQKAKQRWQNVKRDVTGSRLGFTGTLKIGGTRHSFGGVSPGNVVMNAWGITGGRQNDGSIEYRQLKESGGPYEPQDREVTGVVTVDPLIIPDLNKGKDPVAPAADGPVPR